MENSVKSDRSPPNGSFVLQQAFWFILAFRIVNALTLRTFFQPDEYYQALEPAWSWTFGHSSHAWLTWEWQHQLRSATYPAIFAFVYAALSHISDLLSLSPSTQTQLLLAAPKIIQACLAALSDYYTYKLGIQVYGDETQGAWYCLALTLTSAWNWFVSTRTFSNCLETTLTIIALYNWPFHWALGSDEAGFQVDEKTLRIRQPGAGNGSPYESNMDETTRLRRSLFCAATAVILRPTNVIIWVVLILATFGRGIWHHGMHWEIGAFLREGVMCGGIILSLTALIDRAYYGIWTLPFWNFFKFNVLQSLAVFYGTNDWHYYLSQGFTLLLIATIIPATHALMHIFYFADHPSALSVQSQTILHRLGLISLILPAVLSIISHKEVRFIYPVLPPLHIVAAGSLAGIWPKARDSKVGTIVHQRGPWRYLVGAIFALNFAIASYFSFVHNSGLLKISEYFHQQLQDHYTTAGSGNEQPKNLTFAILMPCHSIPWRSHFQYIPTEQAAGISGWALTCEPPLGLNATQRSVYLDEADAFYTNPPLWLKLNMARDVPKGRPPPGVYAPIPKRNFYSGSSVSTELLLNEGEGWTNSSTSRSRAWPDYLVFFAHLEPLLQRNLKGSQYSECTRFFNSHFHDDARRVGDVVIWCRHAHQHRTRS